MNIFILDKDIHKSAQYHCDKHVTKMIIETAQIISYAFYRRGITFIGQYKYNQTYINHPCSVWASLSGENIRYLCNLGHQLYNEYCHRYWKQSNDKYSSCKKVFDTGYKRSFLIETGVLTPFAQAIPDDLKNIDAVQAYRDYYMKNKQHLLTYTNREVPEWLTLNGLGKHVIREKR